MAGLLEDLFSGRTSDIYGEGLLTPAQRGGLGNIGLLALAGKLGQLAGPSFSPVPDFGAALGQAAGAYGASQEGAGTAALNAILTGQKGRKLQQELEFGKQLQGSLPELMKLIGGLGSGGGEGSGSTGGGAAASPGAGGGGGGGANGTYWTPEGLAALRPTEGRYDQIHYPSGNPSTASGAYGFLDSTWREQAAKAGVDINKYPRAYLAPPEVQDRVAAITPIHHWTGVDAQGKPFNAAAQRLATNRAYVAGGAAPTAAAPAAPAAPAPAAGGGLLGPTAPNPLSDADPMVGIPKPAWAPQAAAGAPMTGEEARRQRAASDADIKSFYPGGANYVPPVATPGQGASAAETPGFAGRQLVAQLGARAPLDDVSQYRQVAGPGAADAAAAPRAPLPTMGPAGIELPPMQGPLAAPAPAAAAPAAPGPGLLAPPGALPAAALPRGANPAYGNVSNLLGILGVQAEAAGLKNVFAPLADAFRQSPAFQAQLETARRAAGLPFTQAEDLFKKQVEIAGVGPIEAAKLPYTLAQKYFEAEQQIRVAGPVASAQNFERIKADNAAKGIITTMGADGQITLSIDPDAVKAVTGATVTAPKQAEAEIGRETDRIRQEQAARYEPIPGGVPVMGADGKTTMMPMSRYEYDLRQRLQDERRGAGAASSSGPLPGDIVGTPYQTPEAQAQTTEEAKGIGTQNVAARATALASREGLVLLDEARDQLQGAGIFSGIGAGAKATVAQVLSSAGFSNEKLANTQVFLQQAGARTAEILRSGAYGTGTAIGATDLRAADKLANGDNTVEIEAIKRIFALAEQKMRRSIDTNNDIAKMRKNPEQAVEHPPRFLGYVTGPDGKPQKAYQLNDGTKVVRE